MIRVNEIHRHPLKGGTAERLAQTSLRVGEGIPFDRRFAFTGGEFEGPPVVGGWVPSRTFLILTTHPQLARYDVRLSDNNALTVTGPDGERATAIAGQPDTFHAVEKLVRLEFDGGPSGAPKLIEQTPERGHWDFSDTEVSFINLATVRAISDAIGTPLEKERFRGNIYLEGLAPWEEFSWPGRRVSIGDAAIDVTRPIQRCAMTSTALRTGRRDVDVPMGMANAFGHNFCGVYGRVSSNGTISDRDSVEIGDTIVRAPYESLPERAAPPALWPRFANLTVNADQTLGLTSEHKDWPLHEASAGMSVRVLTADNPEASQRLSIIDATPETYVCKQTETALASNARILFSGPAGRPKA